MRVHRAESPTQIELSIKETIEHDEEKTAKSSGSCDEEAPRTPSPTDPQIDKKVPRRTRLCRAAIFAAVLAGTLYAIFAGLGGDVPIPFWPDEDPFDGVEYTWSPGLVDDNGLTLTVLNALEDKWNHYFDISVREWDNGDPDAVRLNTRTMGADPECSPSLGVLKVCNKDYGDTGWEGLNESLTQDGHIVSSISKMNDYYIDVNDADNKEYTMCHEIGHGLGLPHTDESYYNWDKRNCMDYTMRPGNNKKPGRVNFERLAKMYTPDPPEDETSGGGRALTKRREESDTGSSEEEQSRISDALERFQAESSDVLIEDGEVQTFDLGDGFIMVVNMLRVRKF